MSNLAHSLNNGTSDTWLRNAAGAEQKHRRGLGGGGAGVAEDFLLGDTVLSVGSICRVLIYTHYAD